MANERAVDWVRISRLELDCIVGIRAYERDREQRVRLDLALRIDARRAGQTGRIAYTVDYDLVAQNLIELLHFRRYQLIEMAAEELSAMLLCTQSELCEVHLKIEKPGALEGRAQSASVEVQRVREDFQRRDLLGERSGEVLWLETRDAALSVVALAPGATLWVPPTPAAHGLVWPLDAGLRDGDRELPVGVPLRTPKEGAVRNPLPTPVRVFRCALGPQ